MIKDRIKSIIKDLREHGMQGEAHIFFMVYSQNVEKIPTAALVAKEAGANFIFNPAMFNNADVTEKRIRRTLDSDIPKRAQQDLFLVEPSEIMAARPNDHVCPEFADNLSISHSGKLSLCCLYRLDPEFGEYSIAPIKGMTRSDVHRIRTSHPRCRTCAYFAVDHHTHEYYAYATASMVSAVKQRLKKLLP